MMVWSLNLEPDILECEVKWALGSIAMNKACGGDGIPAELFQILKDDSIKVLHSICQQIWKTQQWPQDWKRWQTIFLGSKITGDSDRSHEIKRRLLLGRKALTNLDSILKSRDITLPTKVHLVKAMVFPVIMYRCESWTIKLSTEELMLLNCGVGEDPWESFGPQGDPTNQS